MRQSRSQPKARWALWPEWEAKVRAAFSDDEDVMAVAGFVRRDNLCRPFAAYDLEECWGSEGRYYEALLRLSGAGLLSRCPGTPVFVPVMEPDPCGAEQLAKEER